MNIIKSSKKSIFVEYFTYETSNYSNYRYLFIVHRQY